jgi:hypothetical protein
LSEGAIINFAGGFTMMGVIIWGVMIVAAIVFFRTLVKGEFSFQSNNPAALTVFHDFQPRDKQQAAEIVIEQKAGKKSFEQTNGAKSSFKRIEYRETKQ